MAGLRHPDRMGNAGILRPPDNEIRTIARDLLTGAQFASLAVLLDEPVRPFVSRVAVQARPGNMPVSLISSLARHSCALRNNSLCALMVGEPGPKGDPLTHPRLTLECRASFIARDAPLFAKMRERWLEQHPKSGLYVDFADFGFVRFVIDAAFLNGGFGLASVLSPADLGIEPDRAQA